jgi:hypothetical protein
MGGDEDDQSPTENCDGYGSDAPDGGDASYDSDDADLPDPAAEEPTLSVHHFRPALAKTERQLKKLYKDAASLFSKFDPDVESRLYQRLQVIAVCIQCRMDWPPTREEMDETFRRGVASAKPEFVKDRAADILDRIADELVSIGCGIETLRMLGVGGGEVPARFDNLPPGDLARRLTELGWRTFGVLPGYVERKDWQEPK